MLSKARLMQATITVLLFMFTSCTKSVPEETFDEDFIYDEKSIVNDYLDNEVEVNSSIIDNNEVDFNSLIDVKAIGISWYCKVYSENTVADEFNFYCFDDFVNNLYYFHNDDIDNYYILEDKNYKLNFESNTYTDVEYFDFRYNSLLQFNRVLLNTVREEKPLSISKVYLDNTNTEYYKLSYENMYLYCIGDTIKYVIYRDSINTYVLSLFSVNYGLQETMFHLLDEMEYTHI